MTPAESQTFIRIRLSVAAYAYEMMDTSIMSDAQFDKLCREVDPMVSTGNRKLDAFFRKHFDPSTGVWVRKHPEQRKLERLVREYHLTE